MNWHKWNAAMSYCADKNITFKVVTEATIPVLLRAWSNKSDSTLGTSLLY
jgi:mannose/fructose-specific phosphotransferase system component IIA